MIRVCKSFFSVGHTSKPSYGHKTHNLPLQEAGKERKLKENLYRKVTIAFLLFIA